MSRPVLILGSGKMARNIGAYFLMHGFAVTWYSEHAAHLAECVKSVAKTLRRIGRMRDDVPTAAFTGDCSSIPGGPWQIIEATAESLDKKRMVFDAVGELAARPGAVVLSTSSSLLPADLHPYCIGCHFFYPAELTGVVELILPPSPDAGRVDAVRALLAEVRLIAIEQTERNAFAVNRLLMPLQNEVFRLLVAGYDPAEVDEASVSPHFPLGQCGFMDSVGLDTIRASVENYLGRLSAEEQAAYMHLREGLRMVTGAGKLGRKNGNGLLAGEPLPWQRSGQPLGPRDRDLLREILPRTCGRFVASGQLSEESLALVLTSVFHADDPVFRGGPGGAALQNHG